LQTIRESITNYSGVGKDGEGKKAKKKKPNYPPLSPTKGGRKKSGKKGKGKNRDRVLPVFPRRG